MTLTTEDQVNQLIHDLRGECWHEWELLDGPADDETWRCKRCEADGHKAGFENPNYMQNAKHALELWQEVVASNAWDIHCYCGLWMVSEDTILSDDSICMDHDFCHAICRAYLTSKGVEHQWNL
jgi:hypothetical protein